MSTRHVAHTDETTPGDPPESLQLVLDGFTTGLATRVTFRFAVPLEDASLRWRVWHDGAYQPFELPPIGGTVELPAERFAFGDLLEQR